MGEHARNRGLVPPSFVNAGDGRHEHPTQEFLDEFSFLEQSGWSTASIHVALLGDLCHGRTTHSKVDGLRIFSRVEVDLVAPSELALPKMYEDRMAASGFIIRRFSSIEEYLAQDSVANIWYFTRLQLERMGDKVLDRAADLRKAVTFQREFVGRLPANTRFFHPLPRDARNPTLPFWLDNTELNGWDVQSQNGYFTRIVLLGMLAGHFGYPSRGRSLPSPVGVHATHTATSDTAVLDLTALQDFIYQIPVEDSRRVSWCHRGQECGTSDSISLCVDNGIVLDRLAEGQVVSQVWQVMHSVRSLLGLYGVGEQGVVQQPVRGVISLPDVDFGQWTSTRLKKLAAMVPGSEVIVIQHGKIAQMFQLLVPPQVYNFPGISCKNESCISHRKSMQREVHAHFFRNVAWDKAPKSQAFVCKFCEQLYDFWHIWDYEGRDS